MDEIDDSCHLRPTTGKLIHACGVDPCKRRGRSSVSTNEAPASRDAGQSGAGGGRALSVGRRAAGELRSRGLEVDVLIGENAAETAGLAYQAAAGGVDAVIACGGDGMVHLAIAALAGTEVALGVVPCGTGNDFARSIGLPLTSMSAALDVIAGRHRRSVDLGKAGDRWFGAVLSSGFDSRVNDRANRMSWPRGRMRYSLAMIAELAAFRPLRYRLRLDDTEFETSAMLVAIGNGPSYGGGMRICPGASMVDGLLEVTVISEISRAKLLHLFPSVFSGRHVLRREVLTFRAASVSLTAEGVTAYADGEFVAALPLTVTAMPAALRVLVPPDEATTDLEHRPASE